MTLRLVPAIAALVLVACSEPSSLADDGETDASSHDTGAPLDTGPPVDAGPWRPAFAPRIIYENRDVTCAPPPDFTYVAPERPTMTPGNVRWVFDPASDSAAQEVFRSRSMRFQGMAGVPIVATASGGAVAGILPGGSALSVSAEGGLELLAWASGDRDAPLASAPMWLGSASAPAWIVDGSQDVARPSLRVEGPSTGGLMPTELGLPLPGVPRHLSDLVRGSRPTILADGSIVWAPTDSTIMASCRDGRTRWIVEYDRTMPRRGGIMLLAPADRTIILGLGPLYRLDYDGNVVAERLDLEGNWLAHYDETCGLAFRSGDRERDGTITLRGLRFLRGADFSDETWLSAPGALAPTSDCGAWGYDLSSSTMRMTRYRPDRSAGFTLSLPPGDVRVPSAFQALPVELADGRWLLLNEGGELPPTITIIDDETGATVAQYPLDRAVIGASVVPGAYLLTPDGTLYVATSSRIVAVELGVGARMPYAHSHGLNWARTNATWHL